MVLECCHKLYPRLYKISECKVLKTFFFLKVSYCGNIFSDLEMDMYGDTMEEGECNPDAERKGKNRIILTNNV